MAKKLVLCFDGTWNTPDDDGHDHDEIDSKETNVVRLYRPIRGRDTVGERVQPGIVDRPRIVDDRGACAADPDSGT